MKICPCVITSIGFLQPVCIRTGFCVRAQGEAIGTDRRKSCTMTLDRRTSRAYKTHCAVASLSECQNGTRPVAGPGDERPPPQVPWTLCLSPGLPAGCSESFIGHSNTCSVPGSLTTGIRGSGGQALESRRLALLGPLPLHGSASGRRP